MIFARLAADGRLYDVQFLDAPRDASDVPLLAMPSGFGPFVYDAAKQVAVPAPLTAAEKLAAVPEPAQLVDALAVLLSTTPAITSKAKAQAIVDAHAANVSGLL